MSASYLALAYPALALWRDELRAGVRGQQAHRPTTWTYDALWRAACWEASARDGGGRACLIRARELVAEAIGARHVA